MVHTCVNTQTQTRSERGAWHWVHCVIHTHQKECHCTCNHSVAIVSWRQWLHWLLAKMTDTQMPMMVCLHWQWPTNNQTTTQQRHVKERRLSSSSSYYSHNTQSIDGHCWSVSKDAKPDDTQAGVKQKRGSFHSTGRRRRTDRESNCGFHWNIAGRLQVFIQRLLCSNSPLSLLPNLDLPLDWQAMNLFSSTRRSTSPPSSAAAALLLTRWRGHSWFFLFRIGHPNNNSWAQSNYTV